MTATAAARAAADPRAGRRGVGAQARPFAGGLTDTVREDARPAVADAATGAQGLTSVTPS
ncbi:hypothetical protein G3M53_09330, partial [Streptomyces sp. SID7982]|nr:hypothetical protein [Streptomyces sp. SID7982]